MSSGIVLSAELSLIRLKTESEDFERFGEGGMTAKSERLFGVNLYSTSI